MWETNGKTKYFWLIMAADVVILNLSIILAYLIRFKFTLPEENFRPYLQLFLWISIGSIILLNVYKLYAVSPRTRWDDQFYSIVMVAILGFMLNISLTYISANYAFPRSVFLISGVLQLIFLTFWRYFLWKFTKKALGVQKAVIVGSCSDVLETAGRFVDFSESHLEIVGLITDGPGQLVGDGGYQILGSLCDFDKLLTKADHDVVIITPSIDKDIKEKVVCYCYTVGKEVFLIPDLYEVLMIKASLNLIDDIPVFNIKNKAEEYEFIKRLFDLVIGVLITLITLPVAMIIAMIIKLDSPGPVIYKQDRVTKGGKVFTLYKFRTMVQDAESASGPVLAVEDDLRVTRVGKVLRVCRLDELPQLINVIGGDMSLVGPRPERPFFVDQYSKEITGYENRHLIKPGITGIAQIAGKYSTGPKEKLVFDLLYAKKNNVLVDFQILLNTIKILFMKNKD